MHGSGSAQRLNSSGRLDSTSNGVDFQHLRSLHNLPTSAPEAIDVGDYTIEYQVEATGYMQRGLVTGTNVFAQR